MLVCMSMFFENMQLYLYIYVRIYVCQYIYRNKIACTNMYVNIFVLKATGIYIYMYVHSYLCIYKNKCIYIYICVCMYVCVFVFVSMYMYVNTFTYVNMFVCKYKNLCLHLFGSTYEHTIYIDICIYMFAKGSLDEKLPSYQFLKMRGKEE